jgi:PDZ domain
MDSKFSVPQKRFARQFVWILAFVISIDLLSRTSVGDEQAADSASEKFPFVPNRLIAIPIEVFGEIQDLYLATSDSSTTFGESNREKLRRLDLPKDMKLPPASDGTEFFPPPEIKIGMVNPEPLRASKPISISSTLKNLLAEFGGTGTGFLGMDYIQSKVLRLNGDEGYVQFATVATAQAPHSERITLRASSLNMIVGLPTGLESCLVNTASPDSVTVTTKVFTKLLAKRQIMLTQTRSESEKGPLTRLGGLLNWMEIGPFRVHNVLVYEGDSTTIGPAFLARFNVEFDFPNRMAYFTPSKRFGLPDQRLRTGFGTRRFSGKTLINGVDPTGVAARADIRNGDRLLSINGTKLDQMSFFEVRDLLFEPGIELNLTIERDGETRDVVLQTTNEPDPFPVGPERTAEVPSFDFDK